LAKRVNLEVARHTNAVTTNKLAKKIRGALVTNCRVWICALITSIVGAGHAGVVGGICDIEGPTLSLTFSSCQVEVVEWRIA